MILGFRSKIKGVGVYKGELMVYFDIKFPLLSKLISQPKSLLISVTFEHLRRSTLLNS